jgi:lipopolysaccharide transport system ATP-binding protein
VSWSLGDERGNVEDNIALEVREVTKTFKLFDRHGDRVKESFHPFRKRYHRPFNALTNVSFEVRKAETLGIVGRNGSGKSTLLQIICGILQPSGGSLSVHGRVSAILALGAGFNPEFTGRENVFINGAILGLGRAEVKSRLDNIIAFADIGDFFDQPVKTYSSGMYLRLAFAIAVSIEPDILVVDEALAVGDEMFQRKCFARIRAIKGNGGTILFVSHAAGSVVELCDRAILLDRGELILEGTPKFVVGKYHQLVNAPPEQSERLRTEIKGLKECGSSEKVPARQRTRRLVAVPDEGKPFFDPNLVPKTTFSYRTHGVRISEPTIMTLAGEVVNNLVCRQEYIYRYKVEFFETVYSVRFGMLIKTITGLELGGAGWPLPSEAEPVVEAGETALVQWKFRCLLLPGPYFLNAGVLGMVDGKETYLDRVIDAIAIRVQQERGLFATTIVDFTIEPCEVSFLQRADCGESASDGQ